MNGCIDTTGSYVEMCICYTELKHPFCFTVYPFPQKFVMPTLESCRYARGWVGLEIFSLLSRRWVLCKVSGWLELLVDVVRPNNTVHCSQCFVSTYMWGESRLTSEFRL